MDIISIKDLSDMDAAHLRLLYACWETTIWPALHDVDAATKAQCRNILVFWSEVSENPNKNTKAPFWLLES